MEASGLGVTLSGDTNDGQLLASPQLAGEEFDDRTLPDPERSQESDDGRSTLLSDHLCKIAGYVPVGELIVGSVRNGYVRKEPTLWWIGSRGHSHTYTNVI